MDTGSGNLNPSSIIDLKAELHKKYESFRKAKLVQSSESSKHKPLKRKIDEVNKKKVKPITIKKPVEQNTEEELALQKSRLALEAKAQLYEKIVSNNILIDDEENENYLVDFQRKVLYSTPELQNIQTKNASSTSNTVPRDTTAASAENIIPKERSSDPEKISFKYTEDKPRVSNSEPFTHYQNVQQNEVRDHGTGYFAFSMDEKKRKEQMEELSLLRQETEKQRLTKQRLQQKRKTMLQNRLAKICERKNIDQSVLQAFASTETENADVSQPQETDLSSIPLPESDPKPMKKEPKIRPWDTGKNDLQQFVPQKHKTKSQNEWIEERREDRESEFAPPSSYNKY